MDADTPSGWRDLAAKFAPLIVVSLGALGFIADGTTLISNATIRGVISGAFPYASIILALMVAVVALRERFLRERLSKDKTRLQQSQAKTMRRLVRVLGANHLVNMVPDVDPDRLQPIFDELVGLLPGYFGSHHKFSVARANQDGTFTLLATRGMDPAAVKSIEAQSSWQTGRSFYSVLLNDPQRAEYRMFLTSDTAYVDTRSAGDAAKRPSSSQAHFLIALRDEDLYKQLPKETIGIMSMGIPKGISLTDDQVQVLYDRVLPLAKTVEVILLSEAVAASSKETPDRSTQSGTGEPS